MNAISTELELVLIKTSIRPFRKKKNAKDQLYNLQRMLHNTSRKNVHHSLHCLWAAVVFSLMTHCTKQKRPHAHVFRGPACTSRKTYLHFPNFLTGAVRERDNDPKPRFLDLQREHLVQKNTETRNGTRQCNTAAKTTPKQMETESICAIRVRICT